MKTEDLSDVYAGLAAVKYRKFPLPKTKAEAAFSLGRQLNALRYFAPQEALLESSRKLRRIPKIRKVFRRVCYSLFSQIQLSSAFATDNSEQLKSLWRNFNLSWEPFDSTQMPSQETIARRTLRHVNFHVLNEKLNESNTHMGGKLDLVVIRPIYDAALDEPLSKSLAKLHDDLSGHLGDKVRRFFILGEVFDQGIHRPEIWLFLSTKICQIKPTFGSLIDAKGWVLMDCYRTPGEIPPDSDWNERFLGFWGSAFAGESPPASISGGF